MDSNCLFTHERQVIDHALFGENPRRSRKYRTFPKQPTIDDSTRLSLPIRRPPTVPHILWLPIRSLNRRTFCGVSRSLRTIEIFSQEDQKDRRREFGVRAAASGSDAALRAERRGEQSNLLTF
jgi:hypothetical protein